MGTKYKSKLLRQTHTLGFPDLSFKKEKKEAYDISLITLQSLRENLMGVRLHKKRPDHILFGTLSIFSIKDPWVKSSLVYPGTQAPVPSWS